MTAPPTPAERETPAGEAMREGVAQWFSTHFNLKAREALRYAGALLSSTGPIASELARLTAERDEARADQRAMLIQVGEHARARGEAEGALAISEKAGIVEGWRDRALAAEATLTTLRADHAAEVARLTEALRFYADEDAWSGQPWRLQFESPGRDGHGSDTARDALATTEMGCSVPGVATSPKEA